MGALAASWSGAVSAGRVLRGPRPWSRRYLAYFEIFPFLIYSNYSCKLIFFQWKLCPQPCQQDFWVDYCSPGNRQAMPCHRWKVWAAAVANEAWGTNPFISYSPMSLVLQLKKLRPPEGSDLSKATQRGKVTLHLHLGQIPRPLITSLSSFQGDRVR